MPIEISHDSSTGKFRLAWRRSALAVVGFSLIATGSAAFIGPWWLPILEAILKRNDITVSSTTQWVGLLMVLAGVVLLLYKHYVPDARAKAINADRKTFAKSGLNIEKVRAYFSNLLDDHSYYSSQDSALIHSVDHFKANENRFKLKEVRLSHAEHSLKAMALHSFVQVHFYPLAGSQNFSDYRYCLEPQWNMDREMLFYNAEHSAEYTRLAEEMTALVKEAKTAFEAWVRAMTQAEVI